MEQKKDIGAEASTSFEIKEDGFAKYRDLMLKKQNMLLGILAGIGAAIVANALWIGLIQLGQKIDFLVLAVGFGIAYAVRYFGKGVEPKFGYAAAAIAFVSIIITYFLIGCILFAKGKNLAFFSVFTYMNLTTALYLLRGIMKTLDVLFWFGAVGVAYYFAFKPLKEQ
jgi:hypothetical protein